MELEREVQLVEALLMRPPMPSEGQTPASQRPYMQFLVALKFQKCISANVQMNEVFLAPALAQDSPSGTGDALPESNRSGKA